jgi:1,4-dihydroxy-2-naphthoyl-CoA synthase
LTSSDCREWPSACLRKSARKKTRHTKGHGAKGIVILTGQRPDAFCSGADLKIGHDGDVGKSAPRANILDVQKQIRALPKPVVAMVAARAADG